jgi:hypothetical protein
VILTSSVSQWAETHKIADGLGRLCPSFFHVSGNRDFSIAFIGLPCPTKRTGINFDILESPIAFVDLRGNPKAKPPMARLLMKFRRVSLMGIIPNSRRGRDSPRKRCSNLIIIVSHFSPSQDFSAGRDQLLRISPPPANPA